MLIIIVLILAIITVYLENKIKENKDYKEIKEDINYIEKYNKKQYLLTPTELKFYKLLKTITDKLGYTLFTQVALYEIITPKNFRDFNKIKSKSIDFVITDNNCKIKICIELDDKTHNKKRRILRDKFINELFKELGIKLIRIPVQSFYNLEDIENKIKECL